MPNGEAANAGKKKNAEGISAFGISFSSLGIRHAPLTKCRSHNSLRMSER
jgi:hypothetical protein